MQKEKHTVTIGMDKEIYNLLDYMSLRDTRSRNYLIVTAVEAYCLNNLTEKEIKEAASFVKRKETIQRKRQARK